MRPTCPQHPPSATRYCCVLLAALILTASNPTAWVASSTSKVVILARSHRAGYDVDYLFGAVAIDAPLIDWSGNCGNLSAAVGPAAIHLDLIDDNRAVQNGIQQVRIWQSN